MNNCGRLGLGHWSFFGSLVIGCLVITAAVRADEAVEGQPLAANAKRLLEALNYLGAQLPAETQQAIQAAIKDRDATKIQELLDPHVLFLVNLNPESRVKVAK